MTTRTVWVVSGPETIMLWGVQVPFLTMVLGVLGVLIGHWIAPTIGAPLTMARQAGVIAGSVLLILTIAIAVGQRPWLTASWGLGIGFSGIVIFQTLGAQARAGMKAAGDAVLARLRGKDSEA